MPLEFIIKGSKFFRESGEGIIADINGNVIYMIKPGEECSFTILDVNENIYENIYAKCELFSNSALNKFLGQSDYIFSRNDKEILRIQYSGFLGIKCTILHNNIQMPFPRSKKKFPFHEATFSKKFKLNGSLHISSSTELYSDELICLGAYVWLRNDQSADSG